MSPSRTTLVVTLRSGIRIDQTGDSACGYDQTVRTVSVTTLTTPVVTLQASNIQRRKAGSTSETWSESSRAGREKPRHADVVRLRARERHALVGVSSPPARARQR